MAAGAGQEGGGTDNGRARRGACRSGVFRRRGACVFFSFGAVRTVVFTVLVYPAYPASRPCQLSRLAVPSWGVGKLRASLVHPFTSKIDARSVHMPTTPSGLQYEDTTVGDGAEAKAGQHVHVHYTGWLYNDGVQGAKFDSSRDRNDPFAFSLGAGQVIKGWDEGVAGMKIGGKRTLIIPASLGYGARGAGGVIPPNATLKFDVELLDAH
jgi:FKBP-type peptidyl-prolyl cis-trans isomerase FkpA